MTRPFTIWGGIGGENGVSPTSGNQNPVRRFLDQCAEAGVTRFIPGYIPGQETCLRYDHGRGGYDSKDVVAVLPPFYEVHGWDPLAFLVEEAHSRGIEVHPYNAVGYSGTAAIESQTGSRMPEMRITHFANEHPEAWMRRRDGLSSFDVSGAVVLSYGYPEARAQEQNHFLKMARSHEIDGIQLEFQIESVPGQVDAHGVFVYGYEDPIVQDYRDRSGKDPLSLPNHDEEWTRFQAGYVTQFVRELKQQLDALTKPIRLTAAVASNPNTAYRRLQDWPVWVDEGIIDEIHIRHLTGNLAHIYEYTAAAAATIAGRVPLLAQLLCWGNNKLVTPALIRDGANTALAAGADQVGIYRGDRISELHLWEAARSIARNGGGKALTNQAWVQTR